MAMRATVNKISPARLMEGTRMTPRYFSDGRVLGEEEKAADNIYIRKLEKERREKLKAQQEKAKSDEKPWLFVGLGNPGQKYQGTRHNVGFEMIDAFAESQGISMDTVHCKALFGQGLVGDVPVFLAKPQTYMNLSGESAGPIAAYYKLPLNRVVVFFDDMNLPCGVLRLHPKGGHGSHNGVKSVIHHFRGNREFARLRIGIGKPPGQMDPKAFVLQKFNATARERIDAALREGVGVLNLLVSKGLTESARCFNTEQKYKHIRLQTLQT